MGSLASVLPIVLMFVIFYFLLIRPQQKKQKKVQAMQREMERGDSIITIGGLHGIVDAIDENRIVIKCGETTRLTFDRNAIREVTEKSVKI
jgi:preprotein translocase subunit YajC